jgi:hypothetical protein
LLRSKYGNSFFSGIFVKKFLEGSNGKNYTDICCCWAKKLGPK